MYIIENLDQRYLYPLLEQFGLMSPPGIEPQTPCTIGRYSRKEPSRQLILLSIRSTIYADKSPHYLGDFLPTTVCSLNQLCIQLVHNQCLYLIEYLLAFELRAISYYYYQELCCVCHNPQ